MEALSEPSLHGECEAKLILGYVSGDWFEFTISGAMLLLKLSTFLYRYILGCLKDLRGTVSVRPLREYETVIGL